MMNDQSDFNYWHDRMKGDAQFIQFMTEMYKKQQLDLHMTQHPRSSSSTRNISQLMDHPTATTIWSDSYNKDIYRSAQDTI